MSVAVGGRFAMVVTNASTATTPRHEYSAMKNPFLRNTLPRETFFIRSPPIFLTSHICTMPLFDVSQLLPGSKKIKHFIFNIYTHLQFKSLPVLQFYFATPSSAPSSVPLGTRRRHFLGFAS